MEVYSYNPVSGEYTGRVTAYPNIKEGGFLIPANAVTIEPPIAADNEAPIYITATSKWNIIADYRDQPWYEKSTGYEIDCAYSKPLGELPEEYTLQARPDENYKWDDIINTWVFDKDVEEIKLKALYANELAALDPMLSHILRHERNGELEAAGRAELVFNIAQAEIMEKYNKGTTVFITETGTHYHLTPECSSLSTSETKEINLSDGLKNYIPCSICVNNT